MYILIIMLINILNFKIMGKSLIIPGANFSENAIVIPLRFLLAASSSVTLQNGHVYPSSGVTNADTYFEVMDEDDVPIYNIFAVGTGAGSPNVKEVAINLTTKRIYTNLFNACTGLTRAKITAKCEIDIKNMFLNCGALEYADITGLDITGVYSINLMFRGCTLLKDILFGTKDLSNIKNFTNIFGGCSQLKNISGNISGLGAATLTENATLDLSSCSLLTRESAMVLINGLASSSDGYTRTILFHQSTYDLLSSSDKSAITSAGWIDGNA